MVSLDPTPKEAHQSISWAVVSDRNTVKIMQVEKYISYPFIRKISYFESIRVIKLLQTGVIPKIQDGFYPF